MPFFSYRWSAFLTIPGRILVPSTMIRVFLWMITCVVSEHSVEVNWILFKDIVASSLENYIHVRTVTLLNPPGSLERWEYTFEQKTTTFLCCEVVSAVQRPTSLGTYHFATVVHKASIAEAKHRFFTTLLCPLCWRTIHSSSRMLSILLRDLNWS